MENVNLSLDRKANYAISCLVALLLIFPGKVKSQCIAPTLTFNSPQLISGTDGAIGAVYLFPNVLPGVDAHITIMDMVGGAALAEIDNTTGAGYYDAFQPYVWAGANGTSYIDWKITFKVGGTAVDTFLACLAVTAIDVDGDNLELREFVEAATPGSFAVDPATNLLISFDGVRSRAEGQITTIPNIDTAQRQAMFQMNFKNINSLLYRNGAITPGASQIRQTCIYFAPFFYEWIVLPVRLVSFSAQKQPNSTALNWSATNEQDTRSFTLQKSIDGTSWKDIYTSKTSGTNAISKYSHTDIEQQGGVTYYRLKQVSVNGTITYSKVIKSGDEQQRSETTFTHATVVSSNMNMGVSAVHAETLVIEINNTNGALIARKEYNVREGSNNLQVNLPVQMTAGIYFISVKTKNGKICHRSRLIKG